MTNESLRARINRVKELEKERKRFNPYANSIFYECAPEMLKIIQALESKLEIAREALEFYQKIDDEMKNFTNGFNDKPKIDERSRARIALEAIDLEMTKER